LTTRDDPEAEASAGRLLIMNPPGQGPGGCCLGVKVDLVTERFWVVEWLSGEAPAAR